MTPIEPTMEDGVRPDLVAREREPVAARRGHVLDEGQHRHALLVGERADAGMDQRGLHRRTARRIDHQRDGGETFWSESALDHRIEPVGVEAAAQRPDRADDAVEA